MEVTLKVFETSLRVETDCIFFPISGFCHELIVLAYLFTFDLTFPYPFNLLIVVHYPVTLNREGNNFSLWKQSRDYHVTKPLQFISCCEYFIMSFLSGIVEDEDKGKKHYFFKNSKLIFEYSYNFLPYLELLDSVRLLKD